jgi:hypothetical protein
MKNEFKILLIFGVTLLGLFLSFYFKNQIFAATCGNGVCEAGEVNICCIDCPPTCGNGTCESNCGENSANCSVDCSPTCGNGVCESGENCQNCNIDCPNPTCGNGVCESSCGENASNCPIDCAPTCGNGICESGENPSNCCIDCYQSHYEKKCYDNDVYWYDCYDQRKEKAQECGDSGWADEYRCAGKWVQRKYINRGCSNAQCYSTDQWKDYQYCSNYCLSGKCILPPAVITKGVVVTY